MECTFIVLASKTAKLCFQTSTFPVCELVATPFSANTSHANIFDDAIPV